MMWALWFGCAARGPALDAGGKPIGLVGVHDSYEVEAVQPLPEALSQALIETLSRRGLTVQERDIAASVGRTTAQRIEATSGLSLLVETEARFYSQLNGRYRWVVEIDATVAGPDLPAVTETFSVPVYLRFDHEREDDALAQSAPLVARRIGELLDRTLQ